MQGESAIRQSNDEVVKSSLRVSATNEAIHKNKWIATTCIRKSRNDGVVWIAMIWRCRISQRQKARLLCANLRFVLQWRLYRVFFTSQKLS